MKNSNGENDSCTVPMEFREYFGDDCKMTSDSKKETGFSYTGRGEKLPKDDILFEALGSIDELNAHIGLIIAEMIESENYKTLWTIQKNLSAIMTDLAFAEKKDMTSEVAFSNQNHHLSNKNDSGRLVLKNLAEETERLKKLAGPIGGFTQPGSNKINAAIHITRTICRRAERRTVTMQKTYLFSSEIIEYLNKLSEYIFYLALIEEKESN